MRQLADSQLLNSFAYRDEVQEWPNRLATVCDVDVWWKEYGPVPTG
jgi:hypothetical protein